MDMRLVWHHHCTILLIVLRTVLLLGGEVRLGYIPRGKIAKISPSPHQSAKSSCTPSTSALRDNLDTFQPHPFQRPSKMSGRPTVGILGGDGKASGSTHPLPAVFSAPIRPDIVQYESLAYFLRPEANSDSGPSTLAWPRISDNPTQ